MHAKCTSCKIFDDIVCRELPAATAAWLGCRLSDQTKTGSNVHGIHDVLPLY